MQINGDSIVAFTPLQAKKINLFRLDYENCLEVSDTLRSQLGRADKLIFEYRNLADLNKEKTSVLEKQNTNYSTIISTQKDDILKLTKKVDRRGTTIKILGGGLIVTTALSLGFLLLN